MLKEQYIPQKGLLGAIKRQPKVQHELRAGRCFTSHCALQCRLPWQLFHFSLNAAVQTAEPRSSHRSIAASLCCTTCFYSKPRTQPEMLLISMLCTQALGFSYDCEGSCEGECHRCAAS